MVVWLLSLGVQAQDNQPTEYQVKAAYLYNFAKFVEWPAAAFPDESSPLIIGILGDNPFHEDLERVLKDKTLNKRPLIIKQFNAAKEARNCHIVFISTSLNKRLPEIFSVLHGSSVLTVGETEGFTESGGIVNFIYEGSKVHFQINEPAAKDAGLKISSKLLNLSTKPTH